MLSTIHNLTNLPLLLGEWSFMAFDSNLPNTHGARSCGDVTQRTCRGRPNSVLTTQKQRASGFTNFVTELMSLPYAVGYHWWQWADEPATGRWPDGENSAQPRPPPSALSTRVLDTMMAVCRQLRACAHDGRCLHALDRGDDAHKR